MHDTTKAPTRSKNTSLGHVLPGWGWGLWVGRRHELADFHVLATRANRRISENTNLRHLLTKISTQNLFIDPYIRARHRRGADAKTIPPIPYTQGRANSSKVLPGYPLNIPGGTPGGTPQDIPPGPPGGTPRIQPGGNPGGHLAGSHGGCDDIGHIPCLGSSTRHRRSKPIAVPTSELMFSPWLHQGMIYLGTRHCLELIIGTSC